MPALRVAFDPLPVARWGALFHVLKLERPDVRLEWVPAAFPRSDRSRLDAADVGLFLEPQPEPGLHSLAVGVSRMVVVMAVGHRLARHHELRVAEVLDEPFPDGCELDPAWRGFWTLDAQRGGPPPRSHAEVADPEQAFALVASGRAICTFPEALADGLPHPGLISLPLVDGPPVTTRLVWRAGETNGAVHALVDIARAMYPGLGRR
jgi:DNA-binding transcriptional LysR family regulator